MPERSARLGMHSGIDLPSSRGGTSSPSWWRSRMRRNEAGEDGEHRLPIGLAMGSVERALLMLTTTGGAASSSPASSPVLGEVTPGRAVTAASMFGKVLRRSSPRATALTRELHGGLAVRLAEVKFGTAPVVARSGAPSPSAPQRRSSSWSAGARAVDARTGVALGDGRVRLGRGSALAERRHWTATVRRRTAERQAGSKCRGSRRRAAQRARHHRHHQCRAE